MVPGYVLAERLHRALHGLACRGVSGDERDVVARAYAAWWFRVGRLRGRDVADDYRRANGLYGM